MKNKTRNRAYSAETDSRLLAFDLVGAGIAATVVGLVGIEANETGSQNEVLTPANLKDHQIQITSGDLGFAALAGVGLTVAIVGIRKLFHRA